MDHDVFTRSMLYDATGLVPTAAGEQKETRRPANQYVQVEK